MLHLNHAMSSLEHPEVTVRLRFSPSLSLLPVCIFHVSPSLGFQHLRQNPSPKITKELFCSVSSWRLKTMFFFSLSLSFCCFCFVLFCCVTHFAVLCWRVLVHLFGERCRRPSHLNARPVKM